MAVDGTGEADGGYRSHVAANVYAFLYEYGGYVPMAHEALELTKSVSIGDDDKAMLPKAVRMLRYSIHVGARPATGWLARTAALAGRHPSRGC